MAKVIVEDVQVVSRHWQSWLRVVGFGAVVGLLYWVLSLLIGRYIVEPLACREVVEAAACVNASVTAGKISTVLVASLAIIGMVRVGVVRPIIIAIATAVILWELSVWTMGLFWVESLIWSVVLYALCYGLFGWIVRQASAVSAIIVTIIVVVLIRIALLFW